MYSNAVGPKLDVNGTKPVVLAPDEIGLLDPFGRRSVPFDLVVVDPVGHNVAEENRPAIRLGKLVGRVEADAADPGRAVVVRDHIRAKPDAVVRLAETGIPRSPDELVNRPAMAIGRIEVAHWVEGEPEWIDLSVGVILGMRPIGPHPVGALPDCMRIGLRDPCPANLRGRWNNRGRYI